MAKPRGTEANATGVRLILFYKVGKAVLQTVAALVLLYWGHHGLTASLTRFADNLRHHAVHAWSNILIHVLFKFIHARHGVVFTACALFGDAALSSVEGYALWRGYTWGEWLVVATTSGLIPFELYALTRHFRAGRVVLLLLNVVIVVYLVNRARNRHRPAVVTRTGVPGAGPRPSAGLATSAGQAGAGRR
ncbi:MAG: DUF2127 domain-containing protein [Pseudomonadota bacterium]